MEAPCRQDSFFSYRRRAGGSIGSSDFLPEIFRCSEIGTSGIESSGNEGHRLALDAGGQPPYAASSVRHRHNSQRAAPTDLAPGGFGVALPVGPSVLLVRPPREPQCLCRRHIFLHLSVTFLVEATKGFTSTPGAIVAYAVHVLLRLL